MSELHAVSQSLLRSQMYDLAHFTLSDMTRCGVELRKLGANATSMEEVAARVVNLLYDELQTPPNGSRVCALVRTFVTLPYARLDAAQQAFAARVLPSVTSQPNMKCLTLLATA